MILQIFTKQIYFIVFVFLVGFEIKKSTKSGKYKTKSIRLNNNYISDYDHFEAAMDGLLENPRELEWIDLSFNVISTVDEV